LVCLKANMTESSEQIHKMQVTLEASEGYKRFVHAPILSISSFATGKYIRDLTARESA